MITRAGFAVCALLLAPAAPASARTLPASRAAAQTLVGERRTDLAGASVAGAGTTATDART